MSVRGYFLDTNVLVVAFLLENSDSTRLLALTRGNAVRLLSNEYVLKELRFTLVSKTHVPHEMVETFILDTLGTSITVLKKPSRQEVRSFQWKVRDRSDIPIILPCVKHGLTLVTLDSRLAKSARKRIKVRSPREAINEISRI